MSVLFFKRFLARPLQIAFLVPSSRTLTRKVAEKCDFSQPRILVELGPGDGPHTREIVRRMHPESRLLLIEIDPVLADVMRKQFAHDNRVEVIETDAAFLKEELNKRGLEHCDYVISGLPFSMFNVPTKRRILHAIYESLAPNPRSAFVTYQCTHELKRHATMFARVKSEFCLRNLPPIFVTVYHKQVSNGHKRETPCGCSCGKAHHGVNGHG
ncbi:MAG: rRNA adenine N-6-methyltransferase family protein [Verrucomicrobiota bacterium]